MPPWFLPWPLVGGAIHRDRDSHSRGCRGARGAGGAFEAEEIPGAIVPMPWGRRRVMELGREPPALRQGLIEAV